MEFCQVKKPYLVISCDDWNSYQSIITELPDMSRLELDHSPLPVLINDGEEHALCRRLRSACRVVDFEQWRRDVYFAADGHKNFCKEDSYGAVTPPRSQIICAGGRTIGPAKVLAHYTGRTALQANAQNDFLDRIHSSSTESNSLLAMGLPEIFSGRVIRALAMRTPIAPTGLLSAHSIESLTQVVAWQLLSASIFRQARKHLLMFSDFGLVDAYATEETQSVFTSEFDFAESIESTTEEFQLIGFGGIGTSIHIEMGGDYLLCGKRPNFPQQISKRFHSCQVSDFCVQDPHKRKKKISIESIPTQVLYTQSCRGISLNDSDQSLDLNLGLGSMESGILGFLSTMKRTASHEHYIGVVSSALRSGFSLGDVSQLLSRLHTSGIAEPPSFLLFGDPETSFSAEFGSSFKASHFLEPDDKALTIEITANNSQLLLYEIRKSDLFPSGRELDMTLDEVVVDPSYPSHEGTQIVDFFEWKNSVFVLCGLPTPRPGTRIKIRLSLQDRSRFIAECFARRIGGNLNTLRSIIDGIYSPANATNGSQPRMKADLTRLVSESRQLEFSMASIVKATEWGKSMTTAKREKLLAQLEHCRKKMVALELSVIENSHHWDVPRYFSSIYAKSYFLGKEEFTTKTCSTCLARLDTRLATSIFHSDSNREISHCQRCLLVSDRPQFGVEVSVFGKSEVSFQHPHELQITLQNLQDFPVSVSGVLRFYNGLNFRTLSPNWRNGIQIHLKPKEKQAISLSVEVAQDAMPGNHDILFMYLSEFGIGAAYSNTHLS